MLFNLSYICLITRFVFLKSSVFRWVYLLKLWMFKQTYELCDLYIVSLYYVSVWAYIITYCGSSVYSTQCNFKLSNTGLIMFCLDLNM